MKDFDTRVEWFLARSEAAIEAVNNVGASAMRVEMELYTLKWFDYRFMTPMQATDLFKSEYQKKYKAAWRMYQDAKEAEFKTGTFSTPKFRPPTAIEKTKLQREFTIFWEARKCADRLGLPYDFLIRETIDALMESGGCQTIPRPNQIISALMREDFRNYVLYRWKEYLDGAVYSNSPLPQYMNHAYCGLHAQDAHRDWVLKRLGIGDPFAIGKVCYILQVLPEALALARFGEERMARARLAVACETPAAVAEVERELLAPSCFALPFAFDGESAICAACDFRAKCETLGNYTRGLIRKNYGSEDPRKARERERDRERQRRHRSKQREIKATRA